MIPSVPVSCGELIDKITILEIKVERLRAAAARENAARELALLLAVLNSVGDLPARLAALRQRLGAVNRRLWDIEDNIRMKEAGQSFDAEFVELARAVYVTNDERGRIKRQIDELLQSDIVEEKQYAPYRKADR
jgi:uncharacterized small protein (DUF1192 family)